MYLQYLLNLLEFMSGPKNANFSIILGKFTNYLTDKIINNKVVSKLIS